PKVACVIVFYQQKKIFVLFCAYRKAASILVETGEHKQTRYLQAVKATKPARRATMHPPYLRPVPPGKRLQIAPKRIKLQTEKPQYPGILASSVLRWSAAYCAAYKTRVLRYSLPAAPRANTVQEDTSKMRPRGEVLRRGQGRVHRYGQPALRQ